MPLPPVSDVYKIDVMMDIQGEEIHNVFYYRDTEAIAPDPEDVAVGFWADVKAAWRAIPTTTMSFTFLQIVCEQLFSPFSFFKYAIPVGESLGTRVSASEALAPFIAMYIELVVGTRVTRPGGKRIAGWCEDQVNIGYFNSTALTLGATLGAVLASTFIPIGYTLPMYPVVVGYPNDNRPSAVVQDVTGYFVDQGISHQVSRDPRRS